VSAAGEIFSKIVIFSGQPEIRFPSLQLNPDRMNALLRNFVSVTAFAVITSFPMESAFGQSAKVVGDKAAFDDLQSPEFSGGKQKGFKPKNWLEIETKIKVSLSPEPKSKTCERLTVKWFVAVKNPEKAGSMLLLSRDIEHVNVPLDEEVYCSVYLSPASIKRLTGFDRAGKSSVEAVGYEILVNGEKVASETTKFKVGWWNAASDKISRSDSVPLLTKAETPFANMWWDRYAEVSLKSER
jgi:hypothetical protein